MSIMFGQNGNSKIILSSILHVRLSQPNQLIELIAIVIVRLQKISTMKGLWKFRGGGGEGLRRKNIFGKYDIKLEFFGGGWLCVCGGGGRGVQTKKYPSVGGICFLEQHIIY